MKRTLFAVVNAVLLGVAICHGQTDPEAQKMADTFLNGVKLIDLPEGKKMLNETIWNAPDKQEYPVFTEASTLFEGMFSTEVSTIKGYKRLVEMKGVSKAGTPLVKRYILVAYKDILSAKWKVLQFRESADLEYEANAACTSAADPDDFAKETLRTTDPDILKAVRPLPQFAYLRCGYWSELAGRIGRARAAYLKASDLNKLRPADKEGSGYFRALNSKYTQDYFDFFVRRIEAYADVQ